MRGKVLSLVVAVAFSGVVYGEDSVDVVNSVTVQNASNAVVEVWFNGIQKTIDINGGIVFPCLENELVEVQLGSDISFLECGEKLEVGQ